MGEATVLQITDDLFIPRAELSYRASRAGGPGGQHVNTSSTRVELVWDVDASPSLSDDQRRRVKEKLGNRISGEGHLILAEAGSRSQHQNKEAVTDRFQELLREALFIQKPRKRTRPPRAAKEERLQEKKHRSEIKRMRSDVRDE